MKKIKTLERAAYALLIILLITALMHYHVAEKEEELEEAEKSVMGPYKEPTKDGFIMIFNKKEIEVTAPYVHPPPIFGEVLAYGYLDQNKMRAIGIHNYNYNYMLYMLSAIAGVLVVVHFFKDWKITRGGIIDA